MEKFPNLELFPEIYRSLFEDTVISSVGQITYSCEMRCTPSCSKAARPASNADCFVSRICTEDRSRPKSPDRTTCTLSPARDTVVQSVRF